jgi:hypothetical protein
MLPSGNSSASDIEGGPPVRIDPPFLGQNSTEKIEPSRIDHRPEHREWLLLIPPNVSWTVI